MLKKTDLQRKTEKEVGKKTEYFLHFFSFLHLLRPMKRDVLALNKTRLLPQQCDRGPML
jgi:hypothetical protein